MFLPNETDPDFSELIENGTNIHFEVEKEYKTIYDNQEDLILIQIFEGEEGLCLKNSLFGKLKLSEISKAK